MSGRRDHYRVRQRRAFLRATIQAPGRDPIEGQVVDLSSRGAGVEIEGSAVLPPPPGEEVDVMLEALVLLDPIRVKARIRQWEQEETIARCGLEFLDEAELDSQIPFVLRREFNRRGALRIQIEGLVEVEVQPESGGAKIDATISDLSAGGMQLEIPPQAEPELSGGERVHLTFLLPGQCEELHLIAVVRSSRKTSLGVQFDDQGSPGSAAQLAKIEEFVSRHVQDDTKTRRR